MSTPVGQGREPGPRRTWWRRLAAVLLLGVGLAVLARAGRRAGAVEPGPAAVADVGRFVRPFATTDPEAPSDDLASLDTVLAGHRLVALGEATHGTREFFQFKHRLIRRMVSHHGSRLLLMEAPWARSRAVDAFLVDGLGTPERAVAGLGFWTWNVEEFVGLVRWLRAWNRAHPTDQVRFVGIDPQFPPSPVMQRAGECPEWGQPSSALSRNR